MARDDIGVIAGSFQKKSYALVLGWSPGPVIAFSSCGEDVGWASTRAISSADVPCVSLRSVSSERLVVKDVLTSALS